MHGRTPYEAAEAFLDPLRLAVSCVAACHITTSAGGRDVLDQLHAWTINRRSGVSLPGGRHLHAMMNYRIIRNDREGYGPFRVKTAAYLYVLEREGVELFAHHWHPLGGSTYVDPHMHFGPALLAVDAPIDHKSHLPTSRMTFEQVIRWTIEFGTTPLQPDWQDRLALAEGPHLLYRTWADRPPTSEPKPQN